MARVLFLEDTATGRKSIWLLITRLTVDILNARTAFFKLLLTMPCLCGLQLQALRNIPPIPSLPEGTGNGVGRLVNTVIGIKPGSPESIAGASSGVLGGNIGVAGFHPELPNLPISPHFEVAKRLSLSLPSADLAKLSAASMALSGFVGPELAPGAPGFSSGMQQLFASTNANMPAFSTLSGFDLHSLLHLSSLASLSALAPALVGENLTSAGALAKLRSLVSGLPSANLGLANAANMPAYSVATAASNLGIDLAAEGGIEQWASALKSMNSLGTMSLNMPSTQLTHLAGVLSSLANIQSGFGVSLSQPGAAGQVQSLLAQFPMRELGQLGMSLPEFSPRLPSSASDFRLPSVSRSSSLSVPSLPGASPSLNLGNPQRGGHTVAAPGTGDVGRSVGALTSALGSLNIPSLRDVSLAGSVFRSLAGLGIKPMNIPCSKCQFLPV